MWPSRALSQAAKQLGKRRPSLTEQGDRWIMSKWGRRARIGLLMGTVVAYPTGYMILNGPLLKWYFRNRYDFDSVLPSRLEAIVQEVGVHCTC